MAVDVSQAAYQALYNLFQKILGSRDEAANYAEDPHGYLAAEGIGDYDLAGVNVGQVAQQSVQGSNLPGGIQQSVQQGYAGGGGGGTGGAGGGGGGGGYPPPPPAPSPGQSQADYLVQHVNYVTHTSYEGDEYITQQLSNYENYDYSTNIDNSVNLDGPVYGEVELDVNNVNATGDGAVAAGEDVYGAATGDGAVAAGGDQVGAFNTGTVVGAQAGGDINAPVNAAYGDGNIVGENLVGDGNVVDSNLTNSAVGGGDVNVTEIDIDAQDGSAVAFGTGSEANAEQTNTDIHADNSNVNVGGDYVDQNLEQTQNETNVEVDAYNSQVGVQAATGEDIYQDQYVNAEVNQGGGHEDPYGGNGGGEEVATL